MKYNNLVWSDSLLDNGKSHTQKEWIALLKDTEWRLPTVKEYENLVGCKGEFMDDLKEEMNSDWLMTADVLINPFNGEKLPVVLGLNDYDYRFNFNAYGDVISNWPARGVAVKPKKKVRI